MTTRTLRTVFRGNGTVHYADPSNIANTTVVNYVTQPKNAGDVKVFNARTEISSTRKNVSVNDPSCVDPCKTSLNAETISGRLVLSGSIKNQAQVTQLLADLTQNAQKVLANTGAGFPPGDDLVIDFGVV